MPKSPSKINISDYKNAAFYFWLFVIIHTLLWTLGPALTRQSITHDTLESITWGLQWQWGYYKHPFLTAWLCAAISELFTTVGWPVYLLAQLAVATTFWAVWRLAKQLFPPSHALIGTLVLEGVLFYNINSFNLTPDTLQSPLWALLGLYFYQAVTTQKIRNWLLTALFAALSLCTKYQVALLLLPMLFFCLVNPIARLSFKKSGLYIALIAFCILITPHLVWLYQNQFITLAYAAEASADYTQNKTLLDHLSYPLLYLMNNFLVVGYVFILLWPFYSRLKSRKILNAFQYQFLLFAGLGPLILSVLLCFLSGDYFPPRWSTPYFFALGLLMMAWLNPVLTTQNKRRFAITLVVFSALLFLGRISTFTWFPRAKSDAFLPNKAIALYVCDLWHKNYPAPLPYLAGSNYLVSVITPYIVERPTPYLSWDLKESPWIDEAIIQQQGGIFIWDEGQNYVWDKDSRMHNQLPAFVLKSFPRLKILPSQTFYRLSDHTPIIIGIAILPPRGQTR